MQIRQQLTHRRLAALPIALLMAFASPRVHAVPAADALQHPVEVVVDTAGLEAAARERLHGTIETQLTEELREHGFLVVSDGAAATIVAHVEMPDVELRKYVISVELLVDDRRELVEKAKPCVPCTEREVVEKTVGLLPPLTKRLLQPEPPPPVLEPAPAQVADDSRQLKLGPIGLSGAVTLAAGIATGVAGAVLVSLPRDAGFDLHPRRVGTPTLIVGGLAALLGAAAVVVDVKLLEGRRQARRLQFSADLSQTQAGWSVSGRF